MTRFNTGNREELDASRGPDDTTWSGGGSRRPAAVIGAVGLVAAALAVVTAASVLGIGSDRPSPTTAPSGAVNPAPASGESSAPALSRSPSGSLSGVPVYWIAESMGEPRLYREFRTIPDAGGPAASAVAFMTRGAPLDPDYSTPWKPASRVDVVRSKGMLSIDLSADAFSGTNVGSQLAERAVQQLIFTATAAAAAEHNLADTVRITVDGSAYDAWGAVHVGEPMTRAEALDVLAHSWVTTPVQGARVAAGTVRFTGYGTSFEANFPWQIRDSSGTRVASGSAMSNTGEGFGEFSFSAELTPGNYTVEVSTDDASGGAEGPGAAVDDKEFTVA